jgi:hypothetical protein
MEQTYKEPVLFSMFRSNDEKNVSGTGRVLDGVIFPDGTVVVCWTTCFSSIGVYEDYDTFRAIHVDAHPNNETELRLVYGKTL